MNELFKILKERNITPEILETISSNKIPFEVEVVSPIECVGFSISKVLYFPKFDTYIKLVGVKLTTSTSEVNVWDNWYEVKKQTKTITEYTKI